jgi:hypothetical protein
MGSYRIQNQGTSKVQVASRIISDQKETQVLIDKADLVFIEIWQDLVCSQT